MLILYLKTILFVSSGTGGSVTVVEFFPLKIYQKFVHKITVGFFTWGGQ